MEKEFKDKVVAITGTASGIGRATALAFAAQGAILALADIQKSEGEQTLQMVKELGAEAFFMPIDVTKSVQIDDWVNQIIQQWGRIDIGINNAGIDGADEKTHLYPEDVFKKVIEVNVMGVWYGMRAMIPIMLEKGKGVIINIASIAGLNGFYGHSAYSASKHAVIGLSKTAGVEYGRRGVRVNAVCPSFIETPMVLNAANKPGQLEQLAYINPMKRLGKAEEVANGILFLCSDKASYVNAHSFTIDGGLTAH